MFFNQNIHKNSKDAKLNKAGNHNTYLRLAPVLKTIFHQSVISYTCSQSNSDGSVLKQSHQELDWLQVYDMTHWWKIVLRTEASLHLPLLYVLMRQCSKILNLTNMTKNLGNQWRPRSDCSKGSSLIKFFTVCYFKWEYLFTLKMLQKISSSTHFQI